MIRTRMQRLATGVALAAAAAVLLGAHMRAAAAGGDWKNIQLVYASDVKGKIEPCG